jgi:hypothetical protein
MFSKVTHPREIQKYFTLPLDTKISQMTELLAVTLVCLTWSIVIAT